MTGLVAKIATLPQLELLWEKSLGDPGICIAVLDGPVDQAHPSLSNANLTRLPTLVSGVADHSSASQHGTHVASIIFGQHDNPVWGITPHCRGLIIPVFADGRGGELAPCSQFDLARAITQAVEQGANVINISGGQLAAAAESDQLLANAVRLCQENNVLIVAAAGNDGCDCLHVPAALESVLAVGAMDGQGNPIGFSNWGDAYQSQGILALGENILGAIPGGETAAKTGTSFATPIVSGLVALLLSIQRQRGEKPDPHAIRDAILRSALPCNQALDSRRCLVGTLNISGAYALITKREINKMTNHNLAEIAMQPSEADNTIAPLRGTEVIEFELMPPLAQSASIGVQAAEAPTSTFTPSALSIAGNSMMASPSNPTNAAVAPSECASCSGGGKVQIAYALGDLGYDFGTQAREDSFTQAMPAGMEMLDYLEQNPFEAQSLIWTLNLDATPIYAIAPAGPYASVTYDRLRAFIRDESIERVSIPGYIVGSVRLISGEVVPTIIPEVRGMCSWSVDALLNAVVEPSTPAADREGLRERIREVLDRIYYDYRNLGVTPQERALNYAATNAFQLSVAISQATLNDRVMETIEVVKSPIGRPASDCYDVKLRFVDPENLQRSRTVKRFTIDVSDVMPVTIGQIRSWSEA
jgi:cyanobactin maturation PatA/PatG family protease